jgi:hypothetical protein
MDAVEIQARAAIAAALIISHSVEIPAIPKSQTAPDNAAIRLRELTDYVYRAITSDKV